MRELVCQDCGHGLESHKQNGICGICIGQRGPYLENCACKLTPQGALLKAQRAAAITHLRDMAKELEFYLPHFPAWCLIVDDIIVAIRAYRAIGILKAPKP